MWKTLLLILAVLFSAAAVILLLRVMDLLDGGDGTGEVEGLELIHCKVENNQLQTQWLYCKNAVRQAKVAQGDCASEDACDGGMSTDPGDGGMETDPASSVFSPSPPADKVASCQAQNEELKKAVDTCQGAAAACALGNCP